MGMTHAGGVNCLGHLNELLLVRCGVFAPNKDLDGESSSFQVFQVLGYEENISKPVASLKSKMYVLPFFAVVAM